MNLTKLATTHFGAYCLICVFCPSVLADNGLANKSLEEILAMEHELKAGLGTRDKPRDFMESLSPLDVITLI